MKDLSIVIVNYNVKYFLKGCLDSVYNSNWNGLDIEVWVVDNASVDGSVEMVRSQFPQVNLIDSKDNLGFSKGNNLALRQCNSKYKLLLNPDTIVEEDTFHICYQYMETHKQVGALGVKMIDGTGRFLPESKRALPSLWNSFTKLSGLAGAFPTSQTFNHYALGHLSDEETHNIEVLCGAFMFIRSEALDKVGLLDEAFFMYGEDIDLSYRILKGGYQVHYTPLTKIIHYKGESTKKASFNYVKTFYGAMAIYVRKHYQGFWGSLMAQFIQGAIVFRAGLSLLSRGVTSLFPSIVDGCLMLLGLLGISKWWANYKFADSHHFNIDHNWNMFFYTLIMTTSLFFVGYYKRINWRKRLQGVIGGLTVSLFLYALLPEDLRTSRVVLLMGTILTFFVTAMTGLLWQKTKQEAKKTLIVATAQNAEKIQQELNDYNISYELHGVVAPDYITASAQYINNLNALEELVKVLKIDEVIFDSQDLSMKDIMDKMIGLGSTVSFKIAGDDKLSLLGSDSKNRAGELYSVNIKYNLSEDYYRHTKRSFDLVASICCIVCFPLLLFFNGFKISGYFKNMIAVLIGNKTMVGYNSQTNNLPILPKGIIHTTEKDIHYAKEYSVWKDAETVIKNIRLLA